MNPSTHSPRVRRDKLPPSVFFITDSEGTRESHETLRDSGRWLWFRPTVIMALADRRGGALGWHTRDTGFVRCSPSYEIHFGVNQLGLVTVYAKDVAWLPEWQQRIWAGFNIPPEGGVSEELLAAQAAGQPVDTQAPEPFVANGIKLLNEIVRARVGCRLFREHEQFGSLLARTHRFRATDQAGLFSLAKDLARLTADSINVTCLQKIASPPRGEKWGSLKSLEHVLASYSDAPRARSVLGPLHGAYNLRHADAHLPPGDLTEAFTLLHIDPAAPFVVQGYQLLVSCVAALYEVARILDPSVFNHAPETERGDSG